MGTLDCVDCGCDTGENDHYYMVKNELWDTTAPFKRAILCLICFSQRLGRILHINDFKDVPCNEHITQEFLDEVFHVRQTTSDLCQGQADDTIMQNP